MTDKVAAEGLVSSPASQLDLEPIKVRNEAIRRRRDTPEPERLAVIRAIDNDVPALIAEIERLRAEVSSPARPISYETLWTQIYDAAADAGQILNDDTVTAIADRLGSPARPHQRYRLTLTDHSDGDCISWEAGVTPDPEGPLVKFEDLAASPARPQLEQWQDISTAPERRKVLVTWVNALGKRRTTFASFWPVGTLEMGDGVSEDDVDEDGKNVFAGWYEEFECNDEDMWRLTEQLTHWQPGPAAPGLAEGAASSAPPAPTPDARFATDGEFRASAERVIEKHGPSLKKLALSDTGEK